MAQSKSHPQGSARKQGGGGKQSAHQKNPSVKQFRGLSTIPYGTANHQGGYRMASGYKMKLLKKMERIFSVLHISGVNVNYIKTLPIFNILKKRNTWYLTLVTKRFSGFYSELIQMALPELIQYRAKKKMNKMNRLKRFMGIPSAKNS